MTLNTVFFKENEGPVNGAAQSAVARWSGLGSQPAAVYGGEGFMKSKLPCLELSSGGKQLEDNHEHGKPNTTHFTLFSAPSVAQSVAEDFIRQFCIQMEDVIGDECKSGENGKTPLQLQTAIPLPAATVDYRGHLDLGFGQSLICGKYPYPYPDQCYGVYSSSFGPQFAGRIMLPLRLSSDEGPIFVNAKQYNGIMRRRKKRADFHNKFQLKNRKPYLHLSRHLHAKRRPRGNGGRFLNTKSSSSSSSPKKGESKTMIRSRSTSPGSSSSSSSGVSCSDHDHDLFPFQLNHLHQYSFHHPPFPDVVGNYLKV